MAGFARSVAVATGLCQTGGGLERANPWRRGGAKPTGLAGRESAGLPKGRDMDHREVGVRSRWSSLFLGGRIGGRSWTGW
jgi:hypothetical protein